MFTFSFAIVEYINLFTTEMFSFQSFYMFDMNYSNLVN